VNMTRWKLFRCLLRFGLPVEVGTGGRTKFNRTRLGLPKGHWLDAACVGVSTPERLQAHDVRPLAIAATGHGWRRMCITDRFGFPIRHRSHQKEFYGFKTGDIVCAVVPTGKYAGRHIGRITVRARPSFRVLGFYMHPRHLVRLHRADGYDYGRKEVSALLLEAEARGPCADRF
jgi:hypothetical protein